MTGAVLALEVTEQDRLAACEAVIERGFQTFVEVGEALLEIRDGRLYRAGHSTFESYCRERWGMNRRYANRMIEASQIVENLGPIGPILPANEAQARELAALPADAQREVWQAILETAEEHGITAEWIRRAVQRKIAVMEGRPEKPEIAPLPEGRFSVILADPPWRYDFSNTSGRAVEQHYPTMDFPELRELPVAEIAADDCALFLWATAPKLPEAVDLMAAWGFTYKTQAVWRKSGLGMGYYFRVDHELLLVGTRGSPGVPLPADRISSVVDAEKTRHSEKPDVFRELIERMYPGATRAELFCRSPREGWAVWGDEVGSAS